MATTLTLCNPAGGEEEEIPLLVAQSTSIHDTTVDYRFPLRDVVVQYSNLGLHEVFKRGPCSGQECIPMITIY